MSAKAPFIYNVTLTTKNTQYTQKVPLLTKKIMIQARTSNIVRLAFVTGKVATPTNPYETIKAGTAYYDNDLNTRLTLFLASDTDAVVAEILCWV